MTGSEQVFIIQVSVSSFKNVSNQQQDWQLCEPSENLITKVKTLTGYTTGKEAKEPLVAKPLQELPAAAVILAVRHDNRLRNFPRCTDQSHHCSRAHFYYLFIRGNQSMNALPGEIYTIFTCIIPITRKL